METPVYINHLTSPLPCRKLLLVMQSFPDTSADKFAMLLSTDWFLPFWETIGLETPAQMKGSVQQDCRSVVAQMMDGVKSYFCVDFAPDRVNGTRSALLAVGHKNGLDEETFHRLEGLRAARPERDPTERERTAFLFRAVAGDLLADDQLDASVRQVLRRARIQNFEAGQFQRVCLSSPSEWDNYIRQLTPKLPTYLADWVSGVLAGAEMDSVLGQLTAPQQKQLFTRFRAVAKDITDLPDELLPSSW